MNQNLSESERINARLATEIVAAMGGAASFDSYDAAMKGETYFVPFHWYPGRTGKKNNDKLCAFAACQLGWMRQTETGYEITGVIPDVRAA